MVDSRCYSPVSYTHLEIDYAIVNESPESRAKREKNGWGELTNPRNSEPDGTLNLVPSKDWTSGFFPGELWFLYEYTQNNFWKKKAQQLSLIHI